LRYFVAVVDVGTFTHAAERMYVAQPTPSQQVRRLHVSFAAALQPVPDGPQVQVVFADLEVGPDVGEVFAGGHGTRGVKLGCGDRGADDVDAVEGGLGVDVVLVAPPGERCLADAGDWRPECRPGSKRWRLT